MNAADGRQGEIVADIRLKIRTVVERVGVTDTAVDIIIDLVARGLGRMGGRPPDGTRSKRVTNGFERVSKPPPGESVLDLFSNSSLPENPDSSKLNPTEVVNMMGETGEVAPTPFFRALRQFCEIWRTHYGSGYEPSAADRNQLGRLVKSLTPGLQAELPRAFNNYLDDLSPFVAQEQRHSLRFFCTSGGFNKYRVTAPMLSKKEAATLAGGEQWLAMHGEGRNGKNGAGR